MCLLGSKMCFLSDASRWTDVSCSAAACGGLNERMMARPVVNLTRSKLFS